MSYKVLIIDNDSGKSVVDEEDARAIIGAVTVGRSTRAVGFTDRNVLDLACAIRGMRMVADGFLAEHPELHLMLAIAEGAEN